MHRGKGNGSPSLRERATVTDSIASVLDAAAAGRGGTVLVVGEPGLGKTSVLNHAVDAMPAGMTFGIAQGREMESGVPFGVVAQLLSSLGADPWLDALLGGQPVVEPSAPFHRVARWLEHEVDRPIALVVDDLHWSDADSLHLLAFVSRRVAKLPLAIIAALRPWPKGAGEVARALVAEDHAFLHELGPLSRVEAAALLEQSALVPVSSTAEADTWELCRGNPLLIEQVALALDQGGAIPTRSHDLRRSAETIVLTRFAGLDEIGFECARVASVLGDPLRPDLLAEVGGFDAATIDAAIDAFATSGLMEERPHVGLCFAHPLFAQALYEDIAPAVRRRLHRGCFDVLLARGMRGEAVAHVVRADLVGDERAAAVLEEEGRASLDAGAVATAVQHLEAAVATSSDRCPPQRLLAYVDALATAGRVEECAVVVRGLLRSRSLSWTERAAALRVQGRCGYLAGDVGRGAAAFREAVDLALAHDPVQAVQPLLDESLSAWLVGGPARALPLAVQARQLAADADPALHEQAEATWGHLAMDAGDAEGLAATAPILARLLARGRLASPDPQDHAWPWALVPLMANNAMHAEDLASAHDAFSSALAAAEDAGMANSLATLHIYIANVEIRQGNLTSALSHAVQATDFAELTPGVAEYAAVVRAEALLWLGRLDECEAVCRLVDPVADQQWFARFWLGHVRGLRRLWEGDPGASDEFLVVEATASDAGIGEPCLMHWGANAVAAHALAGRTADGERVVDWLGRQGERLPCRYPRAAARLGRAHLANASGEPADAVEHAQAAAALLGEVDLPLQQAEALVTLGVLHRRASDPVRARTPLAQALAVAEATGARRIADLAEDELRLCGGRRRRQPGEGGLTDAERRVARAAAAGHSNAAVAAQLFLSVNTVESHLTRVYAKLGIRSRRELIAGRSQAIKEALSP